MSLHTIKQHCDAIREHATGEWPDSPEGQRERLAAIESIREKIRELVSNHNRAVLTVVKHHHPEARRIRPHELKDPLEHLQTNHELIDIPTDSACLERLVLDDIEERHPAIPAQAKLLHRFATIVEYQVGMLLVEAQKLHEHNQHGAHEQRIPLPRTEKPVPIIGHA